ncbi:MAG TPA: DUF4177 domain-containing protein [Thermoanaerobaculia bacterium]|jgi:hypothetical protein
MVAREYKTVIVTRPSGFSVRYQPPDIAGVLNREAEDGWRLAQAFPGWLSFWDKVLLILERERPQK